MSDTSKREELIEELGQALRAGMRPERKDAGPLYLDHDVHEYEGLARAALAVFEQAHTPTDAQPRKVPHTGPGHASGDAGFCEGCLAERDQNKRGPECIPGEPFTLEDLAREHDNLAAHPTQMSQTIPAFHTLTAKALRWAAGFRRTAVQEPSGYRVILIQRAREHADEYRRYDDTEDLVGTLVEMANMLASLPEPQGEPTDAQVQAFVTAINAEGFVLDRRAVKAGLRAAYETKGEGR